MLVLPVAKLFYFHNTRRLILSKRNGYSSIYNRHRLNEFEVEGLKQNEQIKNDIENRRDKLSKSKSSISAMKNISDELTLHRIKSEIDNENKLKKLTYDITWPGELGKDSALDFVLSFVASAITTAIATNLDTITEIFLRVPK